MKTLEARVTAISVSEGIVLVDTGAKGSVGVIGAGLKALGSSLDKVRVVVLTHYHPDHVGGLGRLVETTSAKVAVHRLEAGIVSGKEPAPSPHRNPVIAAIARLFLAPFKGTPVKVDYLLEDGDRLPVAEEVRVVHTPGHTAGSICLHLAARKVLIVGDALRYLFRRLGPPASSVTENPRQAAESLRKLLPLDFDVICFGHHPPLQEDARDSLRKLLQRQGS